MDQHVHEALVTQIFELFDTGEEAVSYLSSHELAENRGLLADLEALCSAVASAVEQLAPRIRLENKLKEIGLNAPLTVARISKLLDEGRTDLAQTQCACSLTPLFLFWGGTRNFSCSMRPPTSPWETGMPGNGSASARSGRRRSGTNRRSTALTFPSWCSFTATGK